MYCKKCGTEQKEGQKFCPKCGEPFIEVNEKPHVDDFKQYAQKAHSSKNSLTIQAR